MILWAMRPSYTRVMQGFVPLNKWMTWITLLWGPHVICLIDRSSILEQNKAIYCYSYQNSTTLAMMQFWYECINMGLKYRTARKSPNLQEIKLNDIWQMLALKSALILTKWSHLPDRWKVEFLMLSLFIGGHASPMQKINFFHKKSNPR